MYIECKYPLQPVSTYAFQPDFISIGISYPLLIPAGSTIKWVDQAEDMRNVYIVTWDENMVVLDQDFAEDLPDKNIFEGSPVDKDNPQGTLSKDIVVYSCMCVVSGDMYLVGVDTSKQVVYLESLGMKLYLDLLKLLLTFEPTWIVDFRETTKDAWI